LQATNTSLGISRFRFLCSNCSKVWLTLTKAVKGAVDKDTVNMIV